MTDRYAVIGNPIAHSKSPLIHTEFARQTNQDIDYQAVLAPLDGFAETVARLRKEGCRGCNVTVPFKQEAWQYALDSGMACELPATTAQAVNTLCLDRGIATNTDGMGLIRDIRNNLGFSLEGKRILLMGAGGAARGVLYPLMDQTAFMPTQETPAFIVIANRTPEKAVQITDESDFKLIAARVDSSKPAATKLEACSYEELAGRQFDIVINATSSGLRDELPPLPGNLFARDSLAYDMMYGRQTPFMNFAHEQGASLISGGLGMLVEQAAESFFLWRGIRPETKPVIEKLGSC